MRRLKPSAQTELDVIIRSRRRCAICFGLRQSSSVRRGQIAHLDHDPSNSDVSNLVYLCLEHHDEYDGKTSVSKGLKESEVKAYREELYSFMDSEERLSWPDYPDVSASERSTYPELSIESYDRKIAIYRLVRDFLHAILRDGTVDAAALAKFARETDEALFLF
jgi:hypothetical protein